MNPKPELKIELPQKSKKKTAFANSQCPCGKPFAIEHKKPKRFEPSVGKHTCECGSQFLFHAWVGRSEKDGGKLLHSRFEIIHLSDEAKRKCDRPSQSGVYSP